MTDVPKLQVLPGGSKSSSTFVINQEDHTLGNSLRYTLMRSKDVVLCGYSMPHPSEGKINIRVQTKPDKSAEEAFKGGLETLVAMAEHIGATFATATAAGPGVIVGGSGAASSSSSSSGRRAGAAASAAVGDDDIDLTAAGSAAGGASRSRSTSASSRAGSAAGGAATGGAAASAAAGDKKGRKR